MLHIIDDYYAKGDTLGYTVMRQKESKKTGDTIYSTLGYCTSLAERIDIVIKDSTQEKINGEELIELVEALKFIKCQRRRIDEAIKESWSDKYRDEWLSESMNKPEED